MFCNVSLNWLEVYFRLFFVVSLVYHFEAQANWRNSQTYPIQNPKHTTFFLSSNKNFRATCRRVGEVFFKQKSLTHEDLWQKKFNLIVTLSVTCCAKKYILSSIIFGLFISMAQILTWNTQIHNLLHFLTKRHALAYRV